MPAVALKLLGLDEKQIAVYLILASDGSKRLADIEKHTGIERTVVKRALDGLVREGLAYVSLDKPPQYEAAPITHIFDMELKRLDERRAALLAARERAAKALANLGTPRRPVQHIFHGRREAALTAARLIRAAQESILMVVTRPRVLSDAARLAGAGDNGLFDLIQSRCESGVGLRAVVTLRHPGTTERSRILMQQASASIRHLETQQRLACLIVDGREVLYWAEFDEDDAPDAPGDRAIYSNARGLVETQTAMFEALYAIALEIDPRSTSTPAGGATG
ncbi:MAG: Sugar-specific transcriptional regulator TrmB [Thermoplasmata archaeon]|jgi:sugar-specific transcriptional regulator TrmB|nr:Sugar-specific transcriptional regulator TrmB [Thermoplasmata archaeon]